MLGNFDIKINNQMLTIISEIDEFKGSWKLLGQMAPEKLQALKKVLINNLLLTVTRKKLPGMQNLRIQFLKIGK